MKSYIIKYITTKSHKVAQGKLFSIFSPSCAFFAFVVIFFLFFNISILADDEIKEELITDIVLEDEDTPVVPDERPRRLPAAERQRIEMELKTSTLSELAYWCRTLGLSEGGTRDDLSRRIRNHFDMPEPSTQTSARQKIITIESAQTTEYFSISAIKEDYARLRGDVIINLKDGDSNHRIKADDILFNRSRNILTARGNVTYEKVESDKTETFRGQNITVNIDNWASVFLDGSSSMESDGTSYLFRGQVISRTDQDVTILRKAQISSNSEDETFWSINASRLWLLPGSDFTIFNAVLKVGEIPVMYFPFFFFPTDTLFFHPVVGYRSREGGYVQTTTYILGQPKADSSQTSSLGRILGNSNDTQLQREGLFLRSSGKKTVNPNEVSLKALFDYYANLGAYMGIDLATPKAGFLDPLNLTLGIGLTRTVTNVGGQYTPYAPNYDGTFDYNHSNLFSFSVPFRYRMRLNSAFSGKLGRLSWNFPYYSDPYVDRDFLNRAESMDFVNMLQQGAAIEETAASETEIGIYTWEMSGTLNSSFTGFAPYISRMAINNISMTLGFKTIRSEPVDENNSPIPVSPDDPGRFFYAPDKFTMYNVSGTISGAPLSLGGTSSNTRPQTRTPVEIENPLKGIGIPISPWPADDSSDEKTSSGDILIPPVLRQTFSLPSVGNMRFNVDYSMTPTSSMEMQFMNSRWKTFEQVDWSEYQTILFSMSGSTSTNIRMDHSSNIISNAFSVTGAGTWRDYVDLNEDADIFKDKDGNFDQNLVDAMRRTQYSHTNYKFDQSFTSRLQPFNTNPVFRATNLSYSFGGTLVRSKRYKEGESPPDGPELTPQWFSWVKEETVDGEFIPGLNRHQLAANLAANIMDNNQTFTVSANLPPLDELITTNATVRFWKSETVASFRMEKLTETTAKAFEEKGKFEGDWVYRPIDLRETLRFSNTVSFTHSMILDPEEDFEITSMRSALTLWDLRINYFANKVIKSEFIPVDPDRPYLGGSWRQDPDEEPALHPRELSLTYGKNYRDISIIKNWMGFNFSFNTSVNFNLQQYTNSQFQFTTNLTFKVAGFLDLTMSATSNNQVIWRYFKDVPGMEELTFMYIDGPQNNIFTDLMDSFNFFDITKRERSGFKMQRFSMNAVHHLGDWTATLGISMYPYQDTSLFPPKFVITSDISFLVSWKPITEIKSDVRYDGRTEKWIVTN